MRIQANLNIGERFNGRGIIYVKRSIAQEVGILILILIVVVFVLVVVLVLAL
jgi:hypothetical protein